MWERAASKYYLSALYIAPDGAAHIIHRKLVPAMRERRKGVSAGWDLVVHPTVLCTIGASLCLENWLPEIPRALALAGAELIYAPSYIGLAVRGRFDYYEMWKQMLPASAPAREPPLRALSHRSVGLWRKRPARRRGRRAS